MFGWLVGLFVWLVCLVGLFGWLVWFGWFGLVGWFGWFGLVGLFCVVLFFWCFVVDVVEDLEVTKPNILKLTHKQNINMKINVYKYVHMCMYMYVYAYPCCPA